MSKFVGENDRRNFIVSKSSVDLELDDVERLRSFIPITDQFLLFLDRERERSFDRVIFLFEESRLWKTCLDLGKLLGETCDALGSAELEKV